MDSGFRKAPGGRLMNPFVSSVLSVTFVSKLFGFLRAGVLP